MGWFSKIDAFVKVWQWKCKRNYFLLTMQMKLIVMSKSFGWDLHGWLKNQRRSLCPAASASQSQTNLAANPSILHLSLFLHFFCQCCWSVKLILMTSLYIQCFLTGGNLHFLGNMTFRKDNLEIEIRNFVLKFLSFFEFWLCYLTNLRYLNYTIFPDFVNKLQYESIF